MHAVLKRKNGAPLLVEKLIGTVKSWIIPSQDNVSEWSYVFGFFQSANTIIFKLNELV
jgi:hypothetical protein